MTKKADREPAAHLPVARVCVDVPLVHLDRPFDYLVAAADDAAAQPGVRVKVRFAGQLVAGFLLERVAASEHQGKLAYLDKVVSPERVLDPEIAGLARAVADRYAGTLSDVLRLAVPPRHARAESRPPPPTVTSAHTSTTTPASPSAPGFVSTPAPASASASPTASAPSPAVEPVSAAGATSAFAPEPVPGGGGGETPAGAVAAHGTVAVLPGDVTADVAAGVRAAGRPVEVDEALDQRAAGERGPGERGPGERGPAERTVEEPGRPGDGATPDGSVQLAQSGWSAYVTGAGFLRALAEGRPARAVWSALPGEDWPARIAEAAAATVAGGRGVVVVVADARDLERVDRALGTALGAGRHVALNAAAGPAERYRRFLAASRHQVAVVAGTRAAMFAPVADLGLVVVWDDGDDLHAEQRAPYPHAREVLLTRAQLAGCAALVGGFARTGEGQLLLETGWARELTAGRDVLRARSPHIAPTGDDPQLARDPGAATARLPSLAWQAARQALQAGTPVLVQVPRRGYLPSVACAECRTPARCPHCSGPLGLAGARDVPVCHWCGRASAAYACPACGGRRLRASVTGARRTAEELGRAFPGVPVRTSGRDEVLTSVPGGAAVIVSTPGAEPPAEGGYGAVLLLDTWALLSRADLRAAEETMRRWFSAAALARPGPAGGRVIVVADGSLAPVQALLRWDPGWFAARELAERRELSFPPASRMASLTGTTAAVAEFLETARLPAGAEVLGPVPAADDQERMLIRVTRSRAADLARALRDAAAVRSARKATSPVRVQVDPADLF